MKWTAAVVLGIATAGQASEMDELMELMQMTLELAQISSEISMRQDDLPWFTILEGGEQQPQAGGGFASLLKRNRGQSAFSFASGDRQVGDCEFSDELCFA